MKHTKNQSSDSLSRSAPEKNSHFACEISESDFTPLLSRASRRIARRSKSSSRGSVVIQLPSWPRPRIVHFESKLEQRVLFLLLARKDIVDIWEQPPGITFYDADGRRNRHVFDFLVTLRSGWRIAIAVKPARYAKKEGFVDKLRRVRQVVKKSFADEVVLLTDQDFTKEEALNAERRFDFARSADPNVVKKLRVLVEDEEFPTSIGALSAKLEPRNKSYRAIVLAIYDGLLVADRKQLFDLETVVSKGTAQ